MVKKPLPDKVSWLTISLLLLVVVAIALVATTACGYLSGRVPRRYDPWVNVLTSLLIGLLASQPLKRIGSKIKNRLGRYSP